MKKLLSLALALMMALTLVACGGTQTPAAGSGSQAAPAASGASTGDAPSAGLPDGYPKDPIQIILPYAPGGGSDTLARATITAIDLPVAMVAVNIEGANGLVGTMQAYEANPDGYTILVQTAQDLMGFSLGGITDVPLWEEMIPISNMVAGTNMISTNKETGWTTVEEMVEFAKANPGEIKWSCTGAQGVDYAETNIVLDGLGITEYVTVVPYDSGSSGNVALMGNHVQVSTNSVVEIAGGIASGDIVPLMVVSNERSKRYPDVPASSEKGLDYSSYSPRGFYAPPGTPMEIVNYLADAFQKVCEDQEFVDRAADFGWDAIWKSPEDAMQLMRDDVDFLTPIFESMEMEE